MAERCVERLRSKVCACECLCVCVGVGLGLCVCLLCVRMHALGVKMVSECRNEYERTGYSL